jgi:hypothetical protein
MVSGMKETCRRDKGTEVSEAPEPNLWTCNVCHSDGIFTWQDGSQYDGQWQNGKKHGSGTFKLASGEQQFAENWRRDQKNGRGWLLAADGAQHQGTWVNDRWREA